MPRSRPSKSPRTPAYRARAGYDQAIVTLTDSATKRRRDDWLGGHGTPAGRELYHRLVAAWEAAGRRLPDPQADVIRGWDEPLDMGVVERR